MKDEEKKLWLQACNEWYANSRGKDLGEFMFKAGLKAKEILTKLDQDKLSSQNPMQNNHTYSSRVLAQNCIELSMTGDCRYKNFGFCVNCVKSEPLSKVSLAQEAEQNMADFLGTDVETYLRFKKWLADGKPNLDTQN